MAQAVNDRFKIVERSEYDVIQDPLSVTMHRVVDTDDEAEVTVAYCRTYADAVVVCRLMNTGDLLKKELPRITGKVGMELRENLTRLQRRED